MALCFHYSGSLAILLHKIGMVDEKTAETALTITSEMKKLQGILCGHVFLAEWAWLPANSRILLVCDASELADMEQIALGAVLTSNPLRLKTGHVIAKHEFAQRVNQLLSMRSGTTPRRQRPRLVNTHSLPLNGVAHDEDHRRVASYFFQPDREV